MKNIQLHNILTKKMKQFVFILLCFSPTIVQAQVNSYGSIKGDKLSGQNPFLDASVFDTIDNKSRGRGLNFPRTDLTKWRFQENKLNGTNFPSAFNGLFVYNSGTGQTIQGEGIVVDVSPGFYYFYNPNQTIDISSGRWERILNDSVDIDTHLDSIVLTNDSIYTPYVGSNALNPYIIPDTLFVSATDGMDDDFYKWGVLSPPDTITDDVWTGRGLALGNATHIADSGTYIDPTYFNNLAPVALVGGTNAKIKGQGQPIVETALLNWGYNTELLSSQAGLNNFSSILLGANSNIIGNKGQDFILGYGNNIFEGGILRARSQTIQIGINNVSKQSTSNIMIGKNNSIKNSIKNEIIGDSIIIKGGLSKSVIIGNNITVNDTIRESILFSLTKNTVNNYVRGVISILGCKVGIGTVSPTHTLSVNGTAYKTTDGDEWGTFSDIRSKEYITNYTKGLDFVLQLQPVSFNYKPAMKWGTNTSVGLIAQEVEKVLPATVSTHKMVNKIEDFKFINTNELTYLLINAVTSLKEQNAKKIEKFKILKKENKRMKAWIEKMHDKLGLK